MMMPFSLLSPENFNEMLDCLYKHGDFADGFSIYLVWLAGFS